MPCTNHRWWRHALVAGATTALFLTAACGTNTASSQTTSSGPCQTMPDSTVPPLQKALTEQSTGTYCAHSGVTILVVLKAHDLTPTTAWAAPDITGPDGGMRMLAAPLTSLRGTTVAALSLTTAGSYTVTSTTPDHQSWHVTIDVS